MKELTIAFIGAGNMATALIHGLIANGYPPKHIWASGPSTDKLDQLAQKFGIHTTQNNRTAVAHAHIIVLSVKPRILPKVCNEIKDLVEKQQSLIISVAVGATIELIQKWLEGPHDIVRAMPNTPATIGAGATGLYANHQVSEVQRNNAEAIFRSVGVILWLEQEADIALVCAVSGSGPAYFFYIMEAIEQTVIHMGLSGPIAKLLTEQTVLGAARMALESGHSVKHLRQAVTSPKGTTEAALNVLEQNHVDDSFAQALRAAVDRHTELTQILTIEGEQF